MGRTVPSASILLMQEQAHYSQFKKALAPHDQRTLEQLFIYANFHVAKEAQRKPMLLTAVKGINPILQVLRMPQSASHHPHITVMLPKGKYA